MATYICELCGYVYNPSEGDPDNGIAPNTDFEDLPDDWVCPLCGVGTENFVPAEQARHPEKSTRPVDFLKK